MKKTKLCILALLLMTSLVSCTGKTVSSGDDSTDTGAANTNEAVTTTEGATTTVAISNEVPTFDADVTKTTPIYDTAPSAKTVTYTNFSGSFTVTTSEEIWSANTGIDFESYDFVGSGSDLAADVSDQGLHATYFLVKDDGTTSKVNESVVTGYTGVLAKYVAQNSKALKVYIKQVDLRAMINATAVTAASGTFLTVEYYSNIPASLKVSIGTTKKTTGTNVSRSFTPEVTTENGVTVCKGVTKITVPYVDEGNYYLNLFSSADNTVLASVPISISKGYYSDAEYHLLFSGDWDIIKSDSYGEQLIDLFYNSYSRLVARFDTVGKASKTVTFVADPSYDGVAYSSGTTVVVSTDYANANPTDIGFFSHEITHQVQQYSGFYYSDGAWWVENMANYGGFRYFHWANSNGKYVQVYSPSDSNIWDWGWEPYGDGSKLFFSFMDWMYPTTQNEDGSMNYGLIDTINRAIQSGKLKTDQGVDDPTAPMSLIVAEVTDGRFDCMESLRKYYVEISKKWEDTDGAEGWWFQGFGNYADNFITEDLPFVSNPNYPMVNKDIERGTVTATVLATPVTEGENLAKAGSLYAVSGAEGTAARAFDGNVNSKWFSKSTLTTDKLAYLSGIAGYVSIDLGEEKTFNTYTIYNATSKDGTGNNLTNWDVLVSNNGTDWVFVDTQTDAGKSGIESFNIGSVTARYVQIRFFTPDDAVSNINLYEFELFNVE